MRTWSNGIIVFAFGTTAWESLRNFSSRSRWFAPQFHPNGVGIELMEEGTTILCDMGFGVFSLSVHELKAPDYICMLGSVQEVYLKIEFTVVDILDGARVGACIELDGMDTKEDELSFCVDDWITDQLRSIKRHAESAPKMGL